VAKVAQDERLARFITASKWIRKQDHTVKQDAFMPYPDNTSVTRHIDLSEIEIWQVGLAVASTIQATLHGRADVVADVVRSVRLDVRPDPTTTNPNHAVIIGWPVEKDAQKSRAQQVAANAVFTATPH
jgi:hypothetical protein